MCLHTNLLKEERSKEVSDSEKWKEILYLHMVPLSLWMIDLWSALIIVKDTCAENVEVSSVATWIQRFKRMKQLLLMEHLHITWTKLFSAEAVKIMIAKRFLCLMFYDIWQMSWVQWISKWTLLLILN